MTRGCASQSRPPSRHANVSSDAVQSITDAPHPKFTRLFGFRRRPIWVTLEGIRRRIGEDPNRRLRPDHSEVLFLEMHPRDGTYEPLIGYIILEQSQAAVDLVGHRLVRVRYLDLK